MLLVVLAEEREGSYERDEDDSGQPTPEDDTFLGKIKRKIFG